MFSKLCSCYERVRGIHVQAPLTFMPTPVGGYWMWRCACSSAQDCSVQCGFSHWTGHTRRIPRDKLGFKSMCVVTDNVIGQGQYDVDFSAPSGLSRACHVSSASVWSLHALRTVSAGICEHCISNSEHMCICLIRLQASSEYTELSDSRHNCSTRTQCIWHR